MDVFLVPVGDDSHDLYCEAAADVPISPHAASSTTLWGRALAVFRRVVAEGEAEGNHSGQPHGPKRGTLRRAFTKKLAEAIAEQRLLWHLRRLTAARLWHEDDHPSADALECARQAFRRDFTKHRQWLVIDTLLWLACVPLTILPGPNLPAFYFTFRAVGHYLSMRGARQALDAIAWAPTPTPHLTALRAALVLDADARAASIDEIARSLGLTRLAAFVDKVRA